MLRMIGTVESQRAVVSRSSGSALSRREFRSHKSLLDEKDVSVARVQDHRLG